MAYTPNNPNGQTTSANSAPVVIASDQSAVAVSGPLTDAQLRATDISVLVSPTQSGTVPLEGDENALSVRACPADVFRTSFSNVIASGVDTTYFTVIATGSGQTVSQSAGNLVITSGTTTNAQTIIRSTESFTNEIVARYSLIMSQRIINNSTIIELVDVIGDGLALTVNSATSITVTIPSNPFTSQSVGQSMDIGAITGVAGVPGRYAIASVAGNNVTFTVAGWPGSGSGTCSLFGYNFYRLVSDSTTVTSAVLNSQRNGWAFGNTTVTTPTTASPGYMGTLQLGGGAASYYTQLLASGAVQPTTMRGQIVSPLPKEDAHLYVQIRVLNGTVAPATTTTSTIGMIGVSAFGSQPVSLANTFPQSYNTPQPIQGSVTAAVTGTLTTVTTVTGVTTVSSITSSNSAIPGTIADVASAALTTTTTTATLTPTFGTTYSVNIPVTVVSGTTPTMDVQIQESLDSGTNWTPVYDFPRITATGFYQSPTLTLKGNRVRYVQTVGGTTPSFTRAINRLQSSLATDPVRQLIDRSITLTSLNSTTPSLLADGCNNLMITVNVGAITTTAPQLTLQGSDDNGATFYDIGTALTAVASSSVTLKVNGVRAQFVRARVSTAGVGVTAGYVMVRAWT